MRSLFIGGLSVCLFLWVMPGRAQTDSRPNIIFILADDLGYGDLGCYGQQKIETPHIDALARGGMRFTRFYAGGRMRSVPGQFYDGYAYGTYAYSGQSGIQTGRTIPPPRYALTLAKLLQTHGYYTADFGKWGLGYPGSSGVPSKQGFSLFYGYNCQHLAHDYYPDHLWENDQRVELTANTSVNAIYSADLIHQHAMTFLRQPKEKPFFLFLSYTLPHAALSVPHDEVYDHYVQKFHEPPRNDAETPHYEKAAFEPYPHAAYAAMVARLDKYVGEIRAALERRGLAKNTLIIFSSDNGPHREGGNDPDFFDSNGPLKGIKRDLYEGGIREPFIAYWPDKIKAGSVSTFTGAFWDLYPTFCELAEVPPPANVDGISILPTLFGDTSKQQQHPYLYWEFHENGGRQAIRRGNWKGVRLNVHDQPDAPMELYDLSQDPSEKNNIAAQHPDIVRELTLLMQQAHTPDKNWPLLPDEGPMD